MTQRWEPLLMRVDCCKLYLSDLSFALVSMILGQVTNYQVFQFNIDSFSYPLTFLHYLTSQRSPYSLLTWDTFYFPCSRRLTTPPNSIFADSDKGNNHRYVTLYSVPLLAPKRTFWQNTPKRDHVRIIDYTEYKI